MNSAEIPPPFIFNKGTRRNVQGIVVMALVGGRKSGPKRSMERVHDSFISKTLKQKN